MQILYVFKKLTTKVHSRIRGSGSLYNNIKYDVLGAIIYWVSRRVRPVYRFYPKLLCFIKYKIIAVPYYTLLLIQLYLFFGLTIIHSR